MFHENGFFRIRIMKQTEGQNQPIPQNRTKSNLMK